MWSWNSLSQSVFWCGSRQVPGWHNTEPACFLDVHACHARQGQEVNFLWFWEQGSPCWPFPSRGVHFMARYRLYLRYSNKSLNLLPMAIALSIFELQHRQKLNPSHQMWQSSVNRNCGNPLRTRILGEPAGEGHLITVRGSELTPHWSWSEKQAGKGRKGR